MKSLFAFSFILLNILVINAQILDVPYRSDLSGCGVWCWAKSAHMAIVYYGNDIYLCDVLEFARSQNPTKYGNDNCCNYPDSCCGDGWPSGALQNWSISISDTSGELTLTEIYNDLTISRPFIMHVYSPGHSLIGYGKNGTNIYYHDPGNGSKIHSYNDLVINGVNGKTWQATTRLTISASTCPLIQHIIGRIKISNPVGNVYKAQQDIYASCIIEHTANVEFICGDDIVLEAGFRVDLGGSVILKPGSTFICP